MALASSAIRKGFFLSFMKWLRHRKGKPSEDRKEQEKDQNAAGVILKLATMPQDSPVPGRAQIAGHREARLPLELLPAKLVVGADPS